MIAQAEFHAHNDEVDLEDFCAIMERHQPENLLVKDSGTGESVGDSEGGVEIMGDAESEGGGQADCSTVGKRVDDERGSSCNQRGKVVVTREEVVSNLVELFKEVRETCHPRAYDAIHGILSSRDGWISSAFRGAAACIFAISIDS